MPGNWHVRFGGAALGRRPGETLAPRPRPTPYQAQGWQLTQPEPGVLVFRTPHGRTFTTTPTVHPV